MNLAYTKADEGVCNNMYCGLLAESRGWGQLRRALFFFFPLLPPSFLCLPFHSNPFIFYY